MTRKIIAGVAACVLLTAITLFASEKTQGKKPAAKPKQQAKAVEGQPKQQQKGLLDQLIAAYKADDKEKMGEIIKKMEARRDKMQKLAKLNKWHKWAHRGQGMAGPGWRRGKAMAGPGWGRGRATAGSGWGRGWQMSGGPTCRPCCWQAASAGWRPQAGMQRPMNTWRQQPGGFGAMQGMGPGPQNIAPRTWNMPRGGERQMNLPPADWGW